MNSGALRISALFSRPGDPAYPFRDDRGQLCWIEALTQEGGRLALRQQTSSQSPSQTRVVTPKDFQIRSRVHEYGGRCFCIVEDHIYFNHYADGNIYRQNLHTDAAPIALSANDDNIVGHADLHFSKSLNTVFAIQETQGSAGTDNKNKIVAFDLDHPLPISVETVIEGADFYANISVSSSGDKIAWLQWQHPHMPWDETELYAADIIADKNQITLGHIKQIAGGPNRSVCQSGFLENGNIVFAMDSDTPENAPENYWNLYQSDGNSINSITKNKAEFGEAHWVFGQCRWLQINENTVVATETVNESDQLLEINMLTGEQTKLGPSLARLSQLSRTENGCVGIANFTDKPTEIIEFRRDGPTHSVKREKPWIEPPEVSEPEVICYETRDNAQAYANYYPASADQNENAALLVLVHGGPTSRSDKSLSPLVQYFCQNGFSILDVNHRGSTGHGRAYRQKLLGQWGVVDANDIADAIEWAIQNKDVDRDRVFIRGGSAGGYAVLRALTRFPALFCGGACYYGIGNLITLAEITHKFEGRYTDQLIGEQYDPVTVKQADSRFRSRSPIFDIDKIRSPLILFQGLEDKVVPPQVSREMVHTLKQNGVEHEYIEYEGEGHGFRRAETRIDALNREIAFYRKILDVSAASL